MKKLIFILAVLSGSLVASTLSLATVGGREILAELPSNNIDSDFVKRLDLFLEEHQTDLLKPIFATTSNNENTSFRDYYREVTPAEHKDIEYLILSMDRKSWPSLLIHKKSMNLAGERIRHIHPLRFLHDIFTHEALKVGIRNFRHYKYMGKLYIWDSFIPDLRTNLSKEYAQGNLTDEHMTHFAKATNHPHIQSLLTLMHQQNWNHLVDDMIKNIPRKGNWDRYRMRFRNCD